MMNYILEDTWWLKIRWDIDGFLKHPVGLCFFDTYSNKHKKSIKDVFHNFFIK